MEEDDNKITDIESIHTISTKAGKLQAIVRRDPISRKHLVYFCKEATSDEIVEKLIKTNFAQNLLRKAQKSHE